MFRLKVALALLFVAACASVPVRPDPSTALTSFVSAMINADADALAAIFAEDATVFMPFDSAPRRIEGREEIRKAFAPLFEQVRKSASAPPYMKLEPRDVMTQRIGEDVAILTFHLGDAAATAPTMFSRRTLVVRFENGRWVVEHLHASNLRLTPR